MKDAGFDVSLDIKSIPWNDLAPSNGVLPYDVILTPGDPTHHGDDVDLLISFWYGDNA